MHAQRVFKASWFWLTKNNFFLQASPTVLGVQGLLLDFSGETAFWIKERGKVKTLARVGQKRRGEVRLWSFASFIGQRHFSVKEKYFRRPPMKPYLCLKYYYECIKN